MTDLLVEDVCGKFEKIMWHDSKLLGVTIMRNQLTHTDDVTLTLLLRRSKETLLAPANLDFRECALINFDVDLDGKRVCADDIASGQCSRRSEWMETFEKEHPYDQPLTNFFHFRLQLISPGGNLNFIARDFRLVFKN